MIPSIHNKNYITGCVCVCITAYMKFIGTKSVKNNEKNFCLHLFLLFFCNQFDTTRAKRHAPYTKFNETEHETQSLKLIHCDIPLNRVSYEASNEYHSIKRATIIINKTFGFNWKNRRARMPANDNNLLLLLFSQRSDPEVCANNLNWSSKLNQSFRQNYGKTHHLWKKKNDQQQSQLQPQPQSPSTSSSSQPVGRSVGIAVYLRFISYFFLRFLLTLSLSLSSPIWSYYLKYTQQTATLLHVVFRLVSFHFFSLHFTITSRATDKQLLVNVLNKTQNSKYHYCRCDCNTRTTTRCFFCNWNNRTYPNPSDPLHWVGTNRW